MYRVNNYRCLRISVIPYSNRCCDFPFELRQQGNHNEISRDEILLKINKKYSKCPYILGPLLYVTAKCLLHIGTKFKP